jgi:hypothetical protein
MHEEEGSGETQAMQHGAGTGMREPGTAVMSDGVTPSASARYRRPKKIETTMTREMRMRRKNENEI